MIERVSYIADDGTAFEDEDECIDYEYASRWDGVLPKYVGGDSTPIMDMRGE